MKCKICQSQTCKAFTTVILKKYTVNFQKCPKCGFLFAANPFWLSESYTEAINSTDTGLLQRNFVLHQNVVTLTSFYFPKNLTILDWGGGYGIMVRLLRNNGLKAYWYDEYAQNIFAKTLEANLSETYDLITSFEVFEHLPNPLATIEQMLKRSKNIFFSTLLLPQNIPTFHGEKTWWYYGFNHGQHISFYTKQTLCFIAKKYNLNYTNYGTLHLFSENKINSIFFKLLCFLSNKGLFAIIKLLKNLGIYNKMYKN